MQTIKTIRSRTFKVILLALTVIYLFFSVGVIKATHFCMGREASVAFFSSEAEKCFCSTFLTEKGACCDDKQEVIKIDKDQKIISALNLQVPDLMLLEAFDLEFLAMLLERNQSSLVIAETNRHNPQKIPLFKSHCAFVFYDSTLVS